MKKKYLLFLLFILLPATYIITKEEMIAPEADPDSEVVAGSDRPNLYEKMRISRRWKKKRQRSKPSRRYYPKGIKHN